MKNFNILRVHWKIRPLGGVTKNQYGGGGGDCLKRWAWTVFQFKGGGERGKKKGGGFLGGGDTPMHTMHDTHSIIVYIGVSTPTQKHNTPLFLAKPSSLPINLATV